MVKKSFFKKSTSTALAITLLAATPALVVTSTSHASYSSQEELLFASLRSFLFPHRSSGSPKKKWAGWCKEWIEIIDSLPQYAPLKKELEKVSHWSNAISIGSRLEKALDPYMDTVPADIRARVKELGKSKMVELIAFYLK